MAFITTASFREDTVSVVQKYSKPCSAANLAVFSSLSLKHSMQRLPSSGSFSRPLTRSKYSPQSQSRQQSSAWDPSLSRQEMSFFCVSSLSSNSSSGQRFGLYQSTVTSKNRLKSSMTEPEQGPQQLCRRSFGRLPSSSATSLSNFRINCSLFIFYSCQLNLTGVERPSALAHISKVNYIVLSRQCQLCVAALEKMV